MQRLFSTFAEGWPGAGLLLQRVLTSTILLYCGASHLFETARLVPSLPYLIASVAGVFLLLGLWTPIAGITIATVEAWISLAWSGNWLIAIVLAGLGATVAMIGPGMWSIDAKLYGQKAPPRPATLGKVPSSKSTNAHSPKSITFNPPKVCNLPLQEVQAGDSTIFPDHNHPI